ncbi:hypothetical protein AMATHDRAFT_68946 [Amanita thiersii Skay4041]|uniref:Invertebrate defensins family profile domain-containing protein n=1 Tax=Amanita thiersii Skay4041 TaxID=703135 RepID=A0A2A9NF09_9AGAR|nr:hypothetical protein AMATHDRAFT_68946 [Amanita thiersii Skay4041]
MQFTNVFAQLVAVALVFSSVVQALPQPEVDLEIAARETQTSCQVGDIWGAGDAACSASCIAQRQGYHGGWCDDHKVCHCTH